jgi:hypothetical protein
MKKSLLIAMLLISLAILSSCASQSRSPEGERITDEEYRRGTQGLELKFMNNAPPDKVYSRSEMDVIIEVRNVGAYPNVDSFDGWIELYGFDERLFSGSYWDGGKFFRPDLQGRSKVFPEGGREMKRFHVNEVRTLFQSELNEPTLIAAACYRYRTIAEPVVCIDPEPYAIFGEDKVCTIDANGKTYALGSQGAPVAVTKLTEEVSGQGIHFGINIKNVGGGKVVDINSLGKCPYELNQYDDVDKVLVKPMLSYDASPRCQPRGDYSDPVRLDESGNGYIFCTFQKPAKRTAVETVLRIELDYNYLDSVKKKIKIVNIDR